MQKENEEHITTLPIYAFNLLVRDCLTVNAILFKMIFLFPHVIGRFSNRCISGILTRQSPYTHHLRPSYNIARGVVALSILIPDLGCF